jgi:hypothetical protein
MRSVRSSVIVVAGSIEHLLSERPCLVKKDGGRKLSPDPPSGAVVGIGIGGCSPEGTATEPVGRTTFHFGDVIRTSGSCQARLPLERWSCPAHHEEEPDWRRGMLESKMPSDARHNPQRRPPCLAGRGSETLQWKGGLHSREGVLFTERGERILAGGPRVSETVRLRKPWSPLSFLLAVGQDQSAPQPPLGHSGTACP